MFIQDQAQRRPPNDPLREDKPPVLPPLRDAPVLTRDGDTLLRDVLKALLLRWPPKLFAVLKRTLLVCLPTVLPVFFSSNVRTEEVVVVPELPPEMRIPEVWLVEVPVLALPKRLLVRSVADVEELPLGALLRFTVTLVELLRPLVRALRKSPLFQRSRRPT